MKRDWFSSFNDAATGLVRSARKQRNLRYHLLFALFVIILSLFLDVSRSEFVVITLVIGMVITAELFNSAIEEVVDLVSENFHPLAKTAKDVAAAAVLVTAGTAFVCGYLVLTPRLEDPVLTVVDYVEKGPELVTALTVLGVIIIVVIGKATFGKGQVLRGGMPSGHAAVAFAMATSMAFITKSFLVMLLSYLLAAMVAQSRLLFRIHSLREVVVGSALGILFAVLVFQLIR